MKRKILMVGLLSPKKGVPHLLESLHRIKEFRQDFFLDIIGDGPCRSEYEKKISDLGLKNKVKIHGLKPKEEVAEHMRNCDFFVLPSLVETFGAVFIEAIATGKPVIATNIGGPNEIINDKVGLLVPPKDIDALTKAINYMLDYYANYTQEYLVRYVQNRFGYEAVGRAFSEVYRMVFSEIELE